MQITMHNIENLSLTEMEELVRSSRHVQFRLKDQVEVYGWIERVLKAQKYREMKRSEKGTVRRFLAKISGLSRAQVTRLIASWMKTRRVRRRPPQRSKFPRLYTAADVKLLAQVDAAHEDLSGPAVRRILKREFTVYNHAEFARLAEISVSHLYNLRLSTSYRRLRIRFHSTHASQVAIGERRKPDPKGKPGYLRVDTVHQGNLDGKPSVYHINAVDTVTQWQVVGCVETISEQHLIPVLEAILHQFPFRIRGFHCDNGSEFINNKVAELLEKLLVEFTKSRAYRTTDNALVEGKNGSVVRKHIGYGPILSEYAEALQKFYTANFNYYLNFHRPCGFATLQNVGRGKQRRVYRADDYRTPYEKLCSLPQWKRSLKRGISAAWLEKQAKRMSDTEAAQRMQEAKLALLASARAQR